jgi:hypothetical protein
MASDNNLKQFRIRNYLAKDFDSLRAQLLEYARLYYPDKIQDFSEASVGGLLLDLAAYAGDVMTFYLDHQYNELDPNTAVETRNIEKIIRNSGVAITGASPAVVEAKLTLEVPAVLNTSTNSYEPVISAMPVVRQNTQFTSFSGIDFTLLQDLDFSRKKSDGTYVASIKIARVGLDGNPLTFSMSLSGVCISGKQSIETFPLGIFTPFPTITLSNNNVTDILSVVDNKGNTYHQVNYLSDDVVYKNVINLAKDSEEISDALKVIPAPYRFVTKVDLSNRSTTLILGGGEDTSIDDDVVPDPSDFAVSFPYSKTFSRSTLNPLQLLKTRTLGVYAPNSVLTVTYRFGGGLSHNVPAKSLNYISTLLIDFPKNPPLEIIATVRNSLLVTNETPSSGGEDAPSTDILRNLIPSARNSQDRIVTKEDLLARVYSIPTNFGKVFRAAIRSNENNPMASQLFIVCRNSNSKLMYASDTLKENLRKYLNPYRLVNDAIDILDAYIVNLTFAFDVLVDPSLNKQIVLQNALIEVKNLLRTTNFSIDQPIIISEITNAISRTSGIVSVINATFYGINDVVNNRAYSNVTFNVKDNTRRGMIYPPPGGIFEIKYPEVDIVGRAV